MARPHNLKILHSKPRFLWKTGDPAQAGMLATTMLGGFAGIAASLKMKFRKKED